MALNSIEKVKAHVLCCLIQTKHETGDFICRKYSVDAIAPRRKRKCKLNIQPKNAILLYRRFDSVFCLFFVMQLIMFIYIAAQ